MVNANKYQYIIPYTLSYNDLLGSIAIIILGLMSNPDNERNIIQKRMVNLLKDAIVVPEELHLQQIRDSCKITQEFFKDTPYKPVVDFTCDLTIENQASRVNYFKKLVDYKEEKGEENRTKI